MATTTRRALRGLLAALTVSAAGVAIAAGGGEPDAGTPGPGLQGEALVEALRGGGLVLYFRHGITDVDTRDRDRQDLSNCASQRVLSAGGREQMRRIGEHARSIGVRVSKVLSSPYCRSIDTARLAFGDTEIEPELRHTVTASDEQVRERAQVLRRLLGEKPPLAGTNTVLSGHTANLQEAAGIWPKPEGVAIVFRPLGDGRFDYMATIHPNHWAVLAALSGR